MRWIWLVVLGACSRPPAPKCPVCAPAPAAHAPAPVEDPLKLARACVIAEHGLRVVIADLQLLAHDVVQGARIMERLEKQQHGALQEPLESTMQSIYGTRPSWAFLAWPKKLAASSPNPPSLDVLWAFIDPQHSASLQKLDNEWTLFAGSNIQAPTAGGMMVLWRDVSFLADIEKLANAKVTIADKVDGDVRGKTCQPLDDKRMAIKVGSAYVVVEAR